MISYYANLDYIAANLCENIDKPELQCNGKCHLAKELLKLEQEEEESSTPNSKTVQEDWTQNLTNFTFQFIQPRISKRCYDEDFSFLINRDDEIITPPPIS